MKIPYLGKFKQSTSCTAKPRDPKGVRTRSLFLRRVTMQRKQGDHQTGGSAALVHQGCRLLQPPVWFSHIPGCSLCPPGQRGLTSTTPAERESNRICTHHFLGIWPNQDRKVHFPSGILVPSKTRSGSTTRKKSEGRRGSRGDSQALPQPTEIIYQKHRLFPRIPIKVTNKARMSSSFMFNIVLMDVDNAIGQEKIKEASVGKYYDWSHRKPEIIYEQTGTRSTNNSTGITKSSKFAGYKHCRFSRCHQWSITKSLEKRSQS